MGILGKRSMVLTWCVACTVLVSLAGDAMTYYVSASGNDAWGGTEGSPWRTIQHALDVVGAGDTVLVRDGTYSEYLQSVRSGGPGTPIVITSYPSETAMIDGASVVGWNTGVTITHDHVHLVGLEVANWPSIGIWVEGSGYVEIRDCTVHDMEYGIGFAAGAHDFLLDDVEIYAFDWFGFDASPSGGSDCYNGTLRDCVAHSARDPGLNVDGFALGHGNQNSFKFVRCETYGVYDGFDISADDTRLAQCSSHDNDNAGFKSWADDVEIENCIAYRNGVCNLEMDWDGDPGSTTVWDCTFFDAPVFNIWVENAEDTLEMRNCILAGGENIGLAFEQLAPPSYIGDHNLFHNRNPDRVITVGYTDEFSLTDLESGAWTVYSGEDGNSLTSSSESAIFVNPAVPDLHLSVGSPAVDSGTSVGAPVADFDGVQRPQGPAHDIGAFEQVAESAAVFRVESDGAVLMDRTLHAACSMISIDAWGKFAAGAVSRHATFSQFDFFPGTQIPSGLTDDEEAYCIEYRNGSKPMPRPYLSSETLPTPLPSST